MHPVQAPAQASSRHIDTPLYAKAIEASRRVRWEIERDVIRGREFDLGRHFLPPGLSLANELEFLSPADSRFLSQVQGRTYAYLFGLVERFIAAKVIDCGQAHALGDQVALEAMVRMADEELKHQALFRRLEDMMEAAMPPGYRRTADPGAVAQAVLGKSTWAVLALTLHIELFVLAHYRASIEPQGTLCPLWKDVFLFHWREESQHALLDELELIREDLKLDRGARDVAVGELIELVGAVDGLLQGQAAADADYFLAHCERDHDAPQRRRVREQLLKAYRWQYIVSGVQLPRFQKVLFALVDDHQSARIQQALAPLAGCVPAVPDAAMAA